MKSLKTGAICVLLSLCAFGANAQQTAAPFNEPDYNKPKIFADLPQRMQLNVDVLETLLNTEVGKNINVFIAPGFNFHGVIVSKSDASSAHTQSVVIKSINRQGATLTFTRNQNEEGGYSYLGRILSFKHGDAFEVAQEDGKLVLVKKELYDLFNE